MTDAERLVVARLVMAIEDWNAPQRFKLGQLRVAEEITTQKRAELEAAMAAAKTLLRRTDDGLQIFPAS